MSIDSSEIRKIAWLARLSPDEAEIQQSAVEMARILDYVSLDLKNCTMEPPFCDDAELFVEHFVNKYQTHRAQ